MEKSRPTAGPIKASRQVLPVVVLVKDDLERMHEFFDGRRLAVARSIYLAIVERCEQDGDEFTRGDLAASAGVTKKTLDDYVPVFEAAGLLYVERRREGPVNLPNVWRLMSVTPVPQAEVRECVYCGAEPDTIDHVVAGGGRRGNLAPACRSCSSSKGAKDVREWIELGARRSWPEVAAALAVVGVRSVPGVTEHPEQSSAQALGVGAVVKEDQGLLPTLPGLSLSYGDDGEGEFRSRVGDVVVPATLLLDAGVLLRRKTKVDGRLVSEVEMSVVVAVVAEINRQADADFGLGAHLRAIVMRIRERPSYDAEAHVRLVQSAWRLRWWEKNGRGRRATPAVIYGNSAVFEQVVQDAVDEKKGRRVEGPGAPAKRFTRED